jgi:hypothetical protein
MLMVVLPVGDLGIGDGRPRRRGDAMGRRMRVPDGRPAKVAMLCVLRGGGSRRVDMAVRSHDEPHDQGRHGDKRRQQA